MCVMPPSGSGRSMFTPVVVHRRLFREAFLLILGGGGVGGNRLTEEHYVLLVLMNEPPLHVCVCVYLNIQSSLRGRVS